MFPSGVTLPGWMRGGIVGVEKRSEDKPMRIVVAALASLLAMPAYSAGPYGRIVVGNWSGGAYTSDRTGAFSHCAVNAGYRNGTRMLTSVTSDFKWLLGFSHPDWKLTPGNTVPLELVFDRSTRLTVTAEVRTPVLITIPMPAESELIRAFRQGQYLELIASDRRLTFALTSTSEMLPALIDCVKQSGNIRGPIASVPATPPAPSPAEAAAKAEKKAVLEKARDLIRTKMLGCIGKEGTPMLLTDEKAEVVAKSAMIFCRADVDALVQATIELVELESGRPANRQAVKQAAESRVQELVVAHVVRSRGEMLNRRNQGAPAPQQSAPGPAISPTL
jgi:hypothetical protein